MSDAVISVERISKAYRLGRIGGATLKEDFARWWARARGKADPLLTTLMFRIVFNKVAR